jgi:hypothetical protein
MYPSIKVTELKYVGAAGTNHNYIHEQVESRLHSENSWYYSV